MTLADINTKINSLLNVDSVTYPYTSRVVDMNIWLHKVVSMIRSAQDEADYDDPNWGNYPIVTIPLTTSRDYYIPQSEKVASIKTVSISYDGTNFYKARPVDSGERILLVDPAGNSTMDALIDGKFSKTFPYYDPKYNSVWIYPIPNATDVANGGKVLIEWTRDAQDITVSDLTAGVLIPGFDITYHPMLAYGPAYDFAYSNNLPQLKNIKLELDELEARLRRDYGDKIKDRELTMNFDNISYK